MPELQRGPRDARDDPSDGTLLARTAQGDLTAFGVAVRRHVRHVTLLAEQLVGDRDDAEDIAEQAFLVALDHAATYDPDRGEFRAWIYGITRGLARRHNLRRSRRFRLWERWGADRGADPGPERAMEARDTLGRVAQVLEDLPEMQRQCFELQVVKGMEVAEVAAMYDVSEATVRQHVFRARRTIRARLGNMEDA